MLIILLWSAVHGEMIVKSLLLASVLCMYRRSQTTPRGGRRGRGPSVQAWVCAKHVMEEVRVCQRHT